MLSALIGLVCVLNLAAPPEVNEVAVAGSVVSILPQGRKTVLIMNRGSANGVEIGDRVVHRNGSCRMSEVYQFRSKCVIEVEAATIGASTAVTIYVRRPAKPPPPREARVLSQAPDEDGMSLELDLGYAHGVRLDDVGLVEGHACRVWQVDAKTSWCETGLRQVTETTVTVSPSAPPDRPMTVSMAKWTMHPHERHTPTPGVASPANPIEVLRLRREGLRASRSCVGVTPDGDRSYWFSADPTPEVQPLPGETGLVLEELAHTSVQTRPIARFGPLEVKRVSGHLEALIADQRLETCHLGGTRMIDPDGRGPLGAVQVWLSDHGRGRGVYLFQEDTTGEIHAGRLGSPMEPLPFSSPAPLPPEPNSAPTARPRFPSIQAVLFLPGKARHLVRIEDRWIPLELAP